MMDVEEQAEAWARKMLTGQKSPPAVFKCFYHQGVDGQFTCAVVLTNAAGGNVDIHIASLPELWKSPSNVRALFKKCFEFCFVVLKSNRVTALIRRDNDQAITFASKIGFSYEGTMRKAADGLDVLIFGMLPEDYHCHRWNNVADQRPNPTDS
jgi:RimJ/RimL family protein N-acetyltransferase